MNPRILVIDDEPRMAEIVGMVLRRDGFEVETHTRSDEALARHKEDPFDLVLTDQSMPNMTGVQLATRLSEMRPELPIILSSGRWGDLDEHALKAAGIRSFMPKPTPFKQVQQLIEEAIASANAPAD